MKKCPNCKEEVIKIPVMIEGKKQLRWVHHPSNIKKCEFTDGISVKIEIVDQFISDKFQELIETEGIDDEKVVAESHAPERSKSNLDYIKERVSKGEISVADFKEIKELL